MNQPRSGKRTATAIGSVRCTPSWEPGSQCRNSGQGTHFPLFLEPRRLAEQVLSGNPGGRIGWMSTRKVDDLMQGTGHDGHLQALGVGLVPEYRRAGVVSEPVARRRMALHLWLDATYLKVQQGGRVVSVVAIIACGVNQERQRENFGIGPRGIGSPSVLGGVSPEPQAPGSFQRRPTGHFRRLRGPQGRHCAGLPGGQLATPSGALLRATFWPLCPRPASPWLAPWSGKCLSDPTPTAPGRFGGRWPINSGLASPRWRI